MEILVEVLSAQLHAIVQQEATREGDLRHSLAYADLPERTKDFHRVLARFIVKHVAPDTVQRMLADTLEN